MRRQRRNRHILAKVRRYFDSTHLDKSAQQDEGTKGPHRITASVNALYNELNIYVSARARELIT